MKKIILFLLLLPLLGFGCRKIKLGADTTISDSLVIQETEWKKTHQGFKEIPEFVGVDGNTYRVDSIVQSHGVGKEESYGYQVYITKQDGFTKSFGEGGLAKSYDWKFITSTATSITST